MSNIVIRKLGYTLDSIWGLFQYPLRKQSLLAKLSSSIPTISVETTNICNANCTFCAYQYQERPTGVMSMELFKKVVDDYVELGGGVLSLTPTVGDPLVDRRLLERIAYAKRFSEITSIGMYTNMISLDRIGGAATLVGSGLASLTISVSGFDEAMYKRVYRSDMYRQVVNNIEAFAEANIAAGKPVELLIDMRSDRPLSEITAYPDYLALAELVGKESFGFRFRYDNWAGLITPDQLTGTMKIREHVPPKLSPCTELYTGPMVYWDGRVGACGCRDINASELIIGDVTRQHLGDIWFGEELKQLRNEFLTDKIKPICASCKHYNNVSQFLARRSKPYLENIRPCRYKANAATSADTRIS